MAQSAATRWSDMFSAGRQQQRHDDSQAAGDAASKWNSSTVASAAVQPWVEKYRPSSLNEIAAQAQVVQVLKATIASKNLPHLLFYGPPGTGKTTTILALARDLFGTTLMRERVLELNASDERGIDVVRNKIKSFAQRVVSNAPNVSPFKIIILDEADSMTPDAQSALRRTIERFSTTTRFCLICNYVSRIIDPLTSRCAKFRFLALPAADARARIELISTSENILLAPGAADTLVKSCDGDLRRAVMRLQMASRLIQKGGALTPEIAESLSGKVPESIIFNLAQLWRAPPHVVHDVEAAINDLVIGQAYPATQVLHQLLDAVVNDNSLTSTAKAQMCDALAECESRLIDGACEETQLIALLHRFIISARQARK